MGKKKESGSGKQRTGSTQKPRRGLYFNVVAVAVGLALIVIGGYFLLQGKDRKEAPPARKMADKQDVRLRETRATKDPGLFTGAARQAYLIAREIPEVLDRLYCYCRCRENFGHKSLLSCYVDNHASV